MTGFINVEGNLTLESDAEILPIPPGELSDYFFLNEMSGGGGGGASTPERKSWRELYE